MADASAGLHEDPQEITPETVERHRAIVSLMEELEAVDWYAQRCDASKDEALRAILAHNRDEEKEHAAMLLEWLRRQDAKLSEELESYLFGTGSILAVEQKENGDGNSAADAGGSLGIGSLKQGASS